MNRQAFGELIDQDPRAQLIPEWKLHWVQWMCDCIDGIMNGDSNYPSNWTDIVRIASGGAMTADPEGYAEWLREHGFDDAAAKFVGLKNPPVTFTPDKPDDEYR